MSNDGIADVPMAAPPPGVTPNFDNPSDNPTGGNVAICSFLFAISVLVLSIRMYTKAFVIKSMGAEDWTALIAAVLFTAFYAVFMVADLQYKQAWHMYDLRMSAFLDMLQIMNIETVLLGVLLLFVKVSILLQYIRILTPTGKKDYIWWTCWPMIVIISLFYFLNTIFWIMLCNPRPKAWTPTMAGTCFDSFKLDLSTAYFNTFTDFIIFVIPHGRIWKLHVRVQQKVKVSAVFAIAAFAVAASALRLYYTYFFYTASDVTLYGTYVFDWAFAEIAAAFLSSCLPSLTKFFRTVGPSVLSLVSMGKTQKSEKYSSDSSSREDSFSNSASIRKGSAAKVTTSEV